MQPENNTLQEPKPSKSILKNSWWLIIITVLSALIIVLVILNYLNDKDKSKKTDDTINTSSSEVSSSSSNSTVLENPSQELTLWYFSGEKWQRTGPAKSCNNPLEVPSPVNVNTVTNILYPGQDRSTSYKTHGGFRFDNNSNNDVSVKLPMEAYVYRGSRYIENGEVQYLFDFINECGVMFRFDHLLKLSSKLQKIADALPEAKVGQSFTTNVSATEKFNKQEEIATQVGFSKTLNVFVDFGMYDLRNLNEASTDSTYAEAKQNIRETAYYGLCWLDFIQSPDRETIKSLPVPGNYKTSDYCK